MKMKITAVLSWIICVVLLFGCSVLQNQPISSTPSTEATTPPQIDPSVSETVPSVTEPSTLETAPTAPANTDPIPSETEPAKQLPYTIRLSGLLSIFDAPTYDGCYVHPIGQDGVYTIVAEQPDAEGNLWGKLKSGVGWVNLTELEAELPLIAGLADESILEKPHHIVIVDDAQFKEYLVFQATERLTDVRFSFLLPDEKGYREDATLHTLPELTPEQPLVAEVVFYGDFTTYGLTFTDAQGQSRYFALYISGRNGAPVLQEFDP